LVDNNQQRLTNEETEAMRELERQTGRRDFIRQLATASLLPPAAASLGIGVFGALGQRSAQAAGQNLRKEWLARWEKNILGDARNRYCDREMGEEIGWLVSPFLNGRPRTRASGWTCSWIGPTPGSGGA
jgi:hypothetical protein